MYIKRIIFGLGKSFYLRKEHKAEVIYFILVSGIRWNVWGGWGYCDNLYF